MNLCRSRVVLPWTESLTTTRQTTWVGPQHTKQKQRKVFKCRLQCQCLTKHVHDVTTFFHLKHLYVLLPLTLCACGMFSFLLIDTVLCGHIELTLIWMVCLPCCFTQIKKQHRTNKRKVKGILEQLSLFSFRWLKWSLCDTVHLKTNRGKLKNYHSDRRKSWHFNFASFYTTKNAVLTNTDVDSGYIWIYFIISIIRTWAVDFSAVSMTSSFIRCCDFQ